MLLAFVQSRDSQSWAKKWERMLAVLFLGNVREFHSEDNLRRMGLRQTICECPPGEGHNRSDRGR